MYFQSHYVECSTFISFFLSLSLSLTYKLSLSLSHTNTHSLMQMNVELSVLHQLLKMHFASDFDRHICIHISEAAESVVLCNRWQAKASVQYFVPETQEGITRFGVQVVPQVCSSILRNQPYTAFITRNILKALSTIRRKE